MNGLENILFWLGIVALIILFAGEPDLMDYLTSNRGPCL